MDLSLFIAKKIAFSRRKNFSSVIIKIAIAAITVSVSVMILTTALIDGFGNGISQKIFGFWGHINITHVAAQTNMENIPLEGNREYYKAIDTLGPITYYKDGISTEERMTRGGVAYIQSYTLLPGIIKTKESLEGIILKGTAKDFHWDKMEDFILKGSIPVFDEKKSSNMIIISSYTANRLKLAVDDQIIIHFIQGNDQLKRKFKVEAIYKTGLDEYDKKLALVDIRKLTRLLKWDDDQVGGFEVFLEDINDMDIFQQYIYHELLPPDVYAETIKQKFPQIFDWLELQKVNEGVILLLMIIVSIINMVTALLILILERTNMIGVLSALGSTKWNIRKIFLLHAVYIIAVGLFLGNLLGLSLGFIQDQFGLIKLDESSYYVSVAPIKFDFLKIVFINLGTLIITFLCLIIPTFLIGKIDPVKAIKFA